jgi:hypothetical protein
MSFSHLGVEAALHQHAHHLQRSIPLFDSVAMHPSGSRS